MDMLVKLYALETSSEYTSGVARHGIEIRRAMAHESIVVAESVEKNFPAESRAWRGEVAAAFGRTPSSCFIAVKDKEVLGFACYDVTAKGFFGPTGVAAKFRKQGVGAALLLTCLHAMRAAGYGYAIIGGVGDDVREFYRQLTGAIEIDGSTPGLYPESALK